jgi:hypothetical protein
MFDGSETTMKKDRVIDSKLDNIFPSSQGSDQKEVEEFVFQVGSEHEKMFKAE